MTPDSPRVGASNSSGVVQWVIPKRTTRGAKNKENLVKIKKNKPKGPALECDSDDHSQNSNSFVNQNYHQSTTETRGDQDGQSKTQKSNIPELNISVDPTTCRTICVIVEQYIKELREHQKSINDARTKLARGVAQSMQTEEGSFIGYNDLSRLRVRDEQTKAIETIKQLTNYLRELSILKSQLVTSTNSVSDIIHNKLSDVCNEIIQTLNDFVLANSDIDIPIIDLDDLNGREYDLCIDAQRSTDTRKLDVSNSQLSQQKTSRPRSRSPTTLMPDQGNVQTSGNLVFLVSDNPQSAESLEQRKQEIQKLEMDTKELRKLFADFYNLVKVQGEQVDSIENNLVAAAQHISEARHHLTHTRPMRGLTVLVPVTGCITGALIGGPIGLIVGGKLGGVTIVCASSLLGLLSSLGAQKCIGSSTCVKYD